MVSSGKRWMVPWHVALEGHLHVSGFLASWRDQRSYNYNYNHLAIPQLSGPDLWILSHQVFASKVSQWRLMHVKNELDIGLGIQIWLTDQQWMSRCDCCDNSLLS